MKLKVDFNRDRNQGQMFPSERQAMYETVVKFQPRRMLEIGTWRGGGSTYILGCAAYEFGGVLDTIESNESFYNDAVKLFDEKMNVLKPHVSFNLGKSDDIIPGLLGLRGAYDFVFFDGAENDTQTVKEYDMLNEHIPLGSIIACHDWKTLKMARLRSIIANDNTWHNIVSIDNTDTGFQMFERSL